MSIRCGCANISVGKRMRCTGSGCSAERVRGTGQTFTGSGGEGVGGTGLTCTICRGERAGGTGTCCGIQTARKEK